jgi:hypothetical protein
VKNTFVRERGFSPREREREKKSARRSFLEHQQQCVGNTNHHHHLIIIVIKSLIHPTAIEKIFFPSF